MKRGMVNQSNEENWNVLYDEWKERFLLFARQQARLAADAEDILQEAFVHVWSRRAIFPHVEPAIVFTQIRRVAIDRARKEQRREKREARYASTEDPWFLPGTGPAEWADLEPVLRKLPLEQQEVLVLKIWGDQTFEAIGRSLDISPNTAASRYRYGLEQLRKEFSQQDIR